MGNKILAVVISALCLLVSLPATEVVYADDTITATLEGDCNGDGEFNISDVVLFQKWLLAVPEVRLKNWKNADLCEDNVLNVFDLCLMKRNLIEKINNFQTPPLG